MKRRAFFKFLAALPLVGLLPSVRAAAVPRTAAELRVAMEGLFVDAQDMHPCAFQEFEVGGVDAPLGRGEFVYRIVPFTWRRKGGTERELVACAWREFSAAAKGFESGTLFWRKVPELAPFENFEDNKSVLGLRFRVAIRPADWEARARAGASYEYVPAFDEIASPQGWPTLTLRR